MVSGAVGHFKPANIKGNEDILLCTLQTAARALKKRHSKFMKFIKTAKAQGGLFVVFDEAHHAPAPSYSKLLETIRDKSGRYGLLGLTATPTRTNEDERGLLKKLFPSGIIASESASKLMSAEILAVPDLIDVRTNEEQPEFNMKHHQKLKFMFGDIPEDIINNLAENKSRNDKIVNHYVTNRKKYGKTIMFADRWYQCEYLREALIKRGVQADAVYSHISADPGSAEARKKRTESDNTRIIEQFKTGSLDVLINVRMLTEGTDVPNVQTAFLTRQTKNKILLTQMVGRALRGPKFGGTKNAYIVSFIDDWKQYISFARPAELVETSDIAIRSLVSSKRILEWIPIDLIRELSRHMDHGHIINPGRYASLSPVGWYPLEYDITASDVDDDIETVSNWIIVYKDYDIWEKFKSKLVDLYGAGNLRDFEDVSLHGSETLDNELKSWWNECGGSSSNFGDHDKNLWDMARYVAQRREPPQFIQFNEWKSHVLDDIARHCIDQKLDQQAINDLLHKEYENNKRSLCHLYPEYDHFKSEFDFSVARILKERRGPGSDTPQQNYTTPEPYPETEAPDETKEYVKHRDNYTCLCCGSINRGWLEVDHIKPQYEVRDHSPENLQTLCRICNSVSVKGTQTIDFRITKTGLASKPDRLPDVPPPRNADAKSVDEWKMYLRRCVNMFYQCSAVADVDVHVRGKRSKVWTIRLHPGNDPDWFRPHIPYLVGNRLTPPPPTNRLMQEHPPRS